MPPKRPTNPPAKRPPKAAKGGAVGAQDTRRIGRREAELQRLDRSMRERSCKELGSGT